MPKKIATKKTRKKSPQADQLSQKWQILFEKADQIPTQKYNMKQTYDRQTGLDHKHLGWGFVVDNKNDRLEVLFKDGIRFLISNYR